MPSATSGSASPAAAQAQLEQQRRRRPRAEGRLELEQACRWAPPNTVPRVSASSIPTKIAGRADGDPVRAKPAGRCSLATFVTALSTSGWPIATSSCPSSAQPNRRDQAGQPAERGQHGADREPAVKGTVEQPPGGQRQHDVEQRKDLRQPADRVLGDVVVVRAGRRQRREGKPQQLRRRGQHRVRGHGTPAAFRDHASGSRDHTHPAGILAVLVVLRFDVPHAVRLRLATPERDGSKRLRGPVANAVGRRLAASASHSRAGGDGREDGLWRLSTASNL